MVLRGGCSVLLFFLWLVCPLNVMSSLWTLVIVTFVLVPFVSVTLVVSVHEVRLVCFFGWRWFYV